ncbi:hypothetical protein ERJ75_000511000 [Trypanosoma vivax]|nr:hypothetical protein ERJ75_000510700 [Trypanosoma vivax]KAH8616147.1 hypothetical protein ERJ75_000511000 [Trypanosoma vivax]
MLRAASGAPGPFACQLGGIRCVFRLGGAPQSAACALFREALSVGLRVRVAPRGRQPPCWRDVAGAVRLPLDARDRAAAVGGGGRRRRFNTPWASLALCLRVRCRRLVRRNRFACCEGGDEQAWTKGNGAAPHERATPDPFSERGAKGADPGRTVPACPTNRQSSASHERPTPEPLTARVEAGTLARRSGGVVRAARRVIGRGRRVGTRWVGGLWSGVGSRLRSTLSH